MMQPCLIYLHGISLVARSLTVVPSAAESDARGAGHVDLLLEGVDLFPNLLGPGAFSTTRGTEEMMCPCLICLHGISLVALQPGRPTRPLSGRAFVRRRVYMQGST